MSERLSAEQLRDVQELPATSAGNVLMRATMRNALLAHISVLEAKLTSSQNAHDACFRKVTTLEAELKRANEKWQLYEREYILPCFQWAKEVGIDLEALVREAKGNCVKRLVQTLQAELQEAREQRDMLQRSLETRAGRELEMLEEVQGMTLQQAIECVRDYRKWYDEKMFTPVTTEETQAVHKQFDGMVDRISAAMARHLIDKLIEQLESLASTQE